MKFVSPKSIGTLDNVRQFKKEKSFFVVSLIRCCVFYYLCKSKKSALSDEAPSDVVF